MTDNLFRDSRSVERADDGLQAHYTTREVAARIWREHLRPHLKLLLIASVAMAFTAATTGAVPLLLKYSIDDVFNANKPEAAYTIALVVVGITAIKSVAEYFASVVTAWLGNRFVSDMRIAMFKRLTRADLAWVEGVHSGRFLTGFLTDATLIRETASRTIVALGESLLKVIVLSSVMFWLDWRLAALILVLMPVGMILMGRQRRKMHKSTSQSLQETGDMSALVSQMLRGLRVVRAYGQEDREIARASGVINRAMEFTMRGVRARAISSPAVEMLTGIGFALAIIFAGTMGAAGDMTIGHFTGFVAATMLLYQPLRSLATLQTAIQEGVAAAGRVFGILDHQPTLNEDPGAAPLKVTSGAIVFENVDFYYDPLKPVLKNFSLTIPPGKTVALVGPSGAGKSTLMHLVLRFYDPQGGSVLIDGQDIKKTTIKSLRDASALVTQDPILFDDSISANIAYGRQNATKEEVSAAARAAAADKFVSALPRGYDSPVGEAGNQLSGGERQRVAIARAFLKNAPILLLDEPTSALDATAEAKVQKALETLMQGRTVLMIAHRLSTVKKADMICVMDHGRIVETGTHQELIARDGLYAHYHSTQIDGAAVRKEQDGPDGNGDETHDHPIDRPGQPEAKVLAGE